MSRPSAKTIIESPSPTGSIHQILESTDNDLFAILYDGRPFMYRIIQKNYSVNGGINYIRNVFTNRISAVNQAARLNRRFTTSAFSVHRIEIK